MKGFRYKHGDRPLEGYTIQRAAGKGGFGEVYYAVSDSGREVALKVIYGYEQIELRGVSQCMNLKSPHLVSIFDVRHNDEGMPFVIMEYVSGPSLRGLLDESPGGLGSQKTAFFLREIGKGLSYLHDCGIVHRDLKPGNIFYENGYVKIGDYGLSKAMSASQHSGQTITVGTVHYMAPEIGAGKYDKSIDIYAMGAVLYEMLTGTVPYLGGSPGEILMKHLSAEPDVSNIEEPFATVIKKAMAKNPNDRYQSVQEMVEAVFGAEHVRESVSCFAPESLSMIAQRVAERVAVGVGAGSKTPPPIPPGARRDRGADVWEQMGNWVDRAGDRVAEFGGRVVNDQWWPASERTGDAAGPRALRGAAIPDPLLMRQRMVLALIVLGVMTIAVAILSSGPGVPESTWFNTLVTTAAMAGGAMLARHKLLPQLAREGVVVQRLAIGGLAAVFMLIIGGMFLPLADGPGVEELAVSGIAALVPLFLLNWVEVMSPDRRERVVLGHAAWSGFIAFIAAMIFEGYPQVAIALAAGTSLLVQVLSPWRNTATASGEREFAPVMREVPGSDVGPDAPTTPMRAWWQKKASGREAHEPNGAAPAAPNGGVPSHDGLVLDLRFRGGGSPAAAQPASAVRKVPRFARYIWLALSTIAVPAGIMMIVFPNYERNIRDDEYAMFIAFGVGHLLFALMCFLKSFQRRFQGWWQYLFKPLLLWACAQSILVAAIMLGSVNMRGDDAMVATFFIVFPAVVILALFFAGLFHREDDDSAAAAARATAGGAAPATRWPAERPAGEAMNAASADAVTTAMPPRTAPPPPPVTTSMAASSYAPNKGSIIHVAAALIGWVLLLGGIVLGILTAIDLPGIIMLGWSEAALRHGPPPGMIRMVMGVGTFVLMLTASGFLMGGRRPQGVAHGLRAVGAVMAAGACICFIYGAFSSRGGLRASEQRLVEMGHPMRHPSQPWDAVDTERPLSAERNLRREVAHGQVLEQYINDIELGFLIPAGAMAVVTATLLGWPAKRPVPVVANA